MDATALAQVLCNSRRTDGAVSLQELHGQLARAGLEEFASAVRSLAERLTLANREMNNELFPWF